MIHDSLIEYLCMFTYIYIYICIYMYMNEDDESMLPTAGPEAEEYH
jgi:hypothetical protein